MTSRPVKFPDELWEQVLKVAEREERSAAWIVRRAVEEYLGGRDVVAGLPLVDAEALAKSQVSYELVDVLHSSAKTAAPKSMVEEGQRERDKIVEAAKADRCICEKPDPTPYGVCRTCKGKR